MIALILTLFLHAAIAAPPTDLTVEPPGESSGLNLNLSWTAAPGASGYAILRSAMKESGPYSLLKADLPPETVSFSDKVTPDPRVEPPQEVYYYRVVAQTPGGPTLQAPSDPDDAEAVAAAEARFVAELLSGGDSSAPAAGRPTADVITTIPGKVTLLALILIVGGLIFRFTAQARAGGEIFIRRIPGIDAIEEGIGRATEMGKPVLYVPGIDELQDIQTIASMLILGQVAQTVAEYQSEIIVSCCIPIVREVADEVVRTGYYQAGAPDAYNPANTRFISSEQFAFCAGTNGIILREKPATNIYLGRFFAESLILAETGFINRSIQIAGTAEATQLPFFIAACDYTLIGEELFAVSAYLSKDPRLVSSLKASDWVKLGLVVCLVVGTLMATAGSDLMITLFTISGE